MSSSTSTSEAAYRRFVPALLGLYVAAIVLNVVVDPFDVFGGDQACFAPHKNEITFNRATILHRVERADPELLVLGTSRVMSFEAERLTEITGRPAHVLSVPAGNIYELRRHLEHVLSRKNIGRVLLGLDYYSFNPRRVPYIGFEEARLQGGEPPWKDYALVATHYKALFESLAVLRACLFGTSSEEAVSTPPAPLPLDLAVRFATRSDFYGTQSLDDVEAMNAELDHLRVIVELARARGVELHLFINPFQYKHWHMIHAVGRSESYRRWKRGLVEIAPLWDFSGNHSVTREDTHFTDTSHYRSHVAEWITRRVLDLDQTGVPGDFGVRLDSLNVESRLQAEAATVDRELVQELEKLLERL